MMQLRYGLIYCLTFILVGCGFHLRSHDYLSPQWHKIALISDSSYSLLTTQFKQTLTYMGGTVVASPQSAPFTLKLISDHFNQTATGASASNQLTTYNLTYTVEYQLLNQQGKALIEPRQVVILRNFTANSNQMLGTTNAQTLLQQDMRRDAVTQLIHQLNSKSLLNALPTLTPIDTP